MISTAETVLLTIRPAREGCRGPAVAPPFTGPPVGGSDGWGSLGPFNGPPGIRCAATAPLAPFTPQG
ncbi:hypothetical protein ACIQOV_13640, partial [Kitasatospora sp. NPDC091257]|uniref:hypothetical protein n=1 Tax=Kitasatospora sp. NPDC091257 TaxID=3364084 RepID=UPI00380A0BD9